MLLTDSRPCFDHVTTTYKQAAVLNEANPLKVTVVTGLGSNTTTNFLEVCRLLKAAGCVKRAVYLRR
jgi:hypothetical protein